MTPHVITAGLVAGLGTAAAVCSAMTCLLCVMPPRHPSDGMVARVSALVLLTALVAVYAAITWRVA